MTKRAKRLVALSLLTSFVVAAGCKETPPPPTPHKDGTDAGMARPHGDVGKGAGKKSPPKLDD